MFITAMSMPQVTCKLQIQYGILEYLWYKRSR